MNTATAFPPGGAHHGNEGADGDISNDVAVCGFSLKFPQEATSADAFWKLMVDKRCAMTEFPPERLCVDGFHQTGGKVNTVSTFQCIQPYTSISARLNKCPFHNRWQTEEATS